MPISARRMLWMGAFALGGYLFTRRWLDFEPTVAIIFAISFAMMGYVLSPGKGDGKGSGSGP